MEQNEKRHLTLAGAVNARDLGGYPAACGRTTAWNVCLRSDSTASLTQEDIHILLQKGLSLVIDLRSPVETSAMPSRLKNIPQVRYENIVMFDQVNSNDLISQLPDDMSEMYIGLLNNCQIQYLQIAKLLLECPSLALFHCTVGKDRTGVLAMLLLQLAGVDYKTIVADYTLTETYLPPKARQESLIKQGRHVPFHVLQAQPETMEKTLDYLLRIWGGAAPYFIHCGLAPQQVEQLKQKLLQ